MQNGLQSASVSRAQRAKFMTWLGKQMLLAWFLRWFLKHCYNVMTWTACHVMTLYDIIVLLHVSFITCGQQANLNINHLITKTFTCPASQHHSPSLLGLACRPMARRPWRQRKINVQPGLWTCHSYTSHPWMNLAIDFRKGSTNLNTNYLHEQKTKEPANNQTWMNQRGRKSTSTLTRLGQQASLTKDQVAPTKQLLLKRLWWPASQP